MGHSLRDMLVEDAPTTYQTGRGKGNLGEIVERSYFGINPGNVSAPDFREAGVELKTTPLKRVGRKLRAKERLVLQMINYDVVCGENWENSSFLSKNQLLLLVFYLWEQGRAPLDYVFEIARLWSFPDEDIEIIRDDWERIVGKIREGRAHELSEGDTLYLAACVKGATGADRRSQPFSEVAAKPRAFSLKASYVNSIIDRSLSAQSVVSADELRSGKTFEQVVHERFAPYIGMSADEIGLRLGVTIRRDAKNYFAALTRRILGGDPTKRIAEFEKADVIVRTIRLRPGGAPKEAISFRAFDYVDLVQQTWEESDLRYDLTRRFFFVVYQLDHSGVPVLSRTQFWTMPVEDVDGQGRQCFETTVNLIMEGKAEYLPRSTQNEVCHVRPHGRDSADTIPTPTGGSAARKSFWLNQRYLADQLASAMDS